jgi:putative toxin-antitoxin system antitoxin component (TIGR02293 family)
MLTTEDKEDIRRIVAETVRSTWPDSSAAQTQPIVELTARAMEVFGTREKALRWLNTPVRSLGDRTPLSLLDTPEGLAQVQDTLGRAEHGVW